MTMDPTRLVFNGIDGDTGEPLLPGVTADRIAAWVLDEPRDGARERELRRWLQQTEERLGPREGVDPGRLAEAGWGVIFPQDGDPRVREALRGLLDLRRRQAAEIEERRYRELTFVPGESKQAFLSRHGAGPGPVDPDRMPYYLLLVGSPEEIPYRFQYQLDVAYAVGRLCFDDLEDYARYAETVVQAETGQLRRPRRVALFGTRNPGDAATALSHDDLAQPLSDLLARNLPAWPVEAALAKEATRDRLLRWLHQPEGPAVLFTASHGVGYGPGSPRQRTHQGALVCQDWPGQGSVKEEHLLHAGEIGDGARVAGLVSFHFGCFTAGTPDCTDFGRDGARQTIAPAPFLAPLAQRLLAHPAGGALAVVGHVDTALDLSFHWPGAGAQIQVFESTLARLLKGQPVGSALEYFNSRYAELSTLLADEREEIRWGKVPDPPLLARLWTACHDARNYIVLGDPAVRLPVEEAP